MQTYANLKPRYSLGQASPRPRVRMKTFSRDLMTLEDQWVFCKGQVRMTHDACLMHPKDTLPLPIAPTWHALLREVQVAAMPVHDAACQGQMHS